MSDADADAHLVERAKLGDVRAFEMLVLKYQRRIERLIGRMVRDTDLVRFEPDGVQSASASFDFRAWDQTSGSVGSKVDATANGGTTAFSSASDTASISVSSGPACGSGATPPMAKPVRSLTKRASARRSGPAMVTGR